MTTSTHRLLGLSLTLAAMAGACAGLESEGLGPDSSRSDELGSSDDGEVRVNVVRRAETLLYFCPPALEDPRCDNAQTDLVDRAPWPIALDVTMPVAITYEGDVEVRTVRTPDVRILLDPIDTVDLSLVASLFTPLSTYGMTIDYRFSPDTPWTQVSPFDPGYWLELGVDPSQEFNFSGRGYACNDCPTLSVDRAIEEIFDHLDTVELRVSVLPVFNYGEFDDGDYDATLNIQ